MGESIGDIFDPSDGRTGHNKRDETRDMKIGD